jgi:hypothetical protein
MFYEREAELSGAVAAFLAEALHAGDPVIVLATDAHVAAFRSALIELGVDVAAHLRQGNLVVGDAHEAVSRYFPAGRFEAERFDAEIGETIRALGDSGREVRVYGELVALLWDEGKVSEAIELEAAWNDLGRRLPFSLFCGYSAEALGSPGGASFNEVCDLHSAVVAGGEGACSHPADSIVVARAEHARSFACDLRSPAHARQFVVRTLEASGAVGLLEDAAIIVAELATNAVLHARSEFVVGVSDADGSVRISVRDASSVVPVRHEPDAHAITGRGLLLVSGLARRWGADVIGGGKVVWAELAR